MTTLIALVVGGLYAAGVYMLLRRSLVKLIVGLVLIGHAANLLVFAVAGLRRGPAPLVPRDQLQLPAAAADPLPQALVLTAIVIGFGILTFAITLFHRAYRAVATDDIDHLRTTDT